MFRHELLLVGSRFLPAWSILGHVAPFYLKPHKLGTLGLAIFFEPVGEDQAQGIVVRLLFDRPQESMFGAHAALRSTARIHIATRFPGLADSPNVKLTCRRGRWSDTSRKPTCPAGQVQRRVRPRSRQRASQPAGPALPAGAASRQTPPPSTTPGRPPTHRGPGRSAAHGSPAQPARVGPPPVRRHRGGRHPPGPLGGTPPALGGRRPRHPGPLRRDSRSGPAT